ncbi:hypothetical protein [Neobacillus drentensis]|uniref:hypothetical protein n=1 Tax=Neobacillus drentensis TaxID=220684 RepID=UPI0030012BC2
MKLHFSKKNKLIVGTITLILVVLLAYAQFFILTPLKTDLGIKEKSLENEQKLLDIVSQKNANTAEPSTVDTSVLQNKVPVRPLQEQFILDLEKAENVSNSKISAMSFSKDTDASSTSNQMNTENTNAAQTSTDPNDANSSIENKQKAPTVPEGLKKLSVQLSVESPTYEDLEKFIETLESLQRIVVVEAITYSGGEEITSLSQTEQSISYSLTASAFYMPGLEDLEDELPEIDAPEPANKDNPLSQFPATAQSQP